MIELPDYGLNARYSIFEHNCACARWLRATWAADEGDALGRDRAGRHDPLHAAETCRVCPDRRSCRLLGADHEAREAAAWEIHKAARDTGFFYVKNHGIDPRLVADAFTEARRFFEQPEEKKREVHVKNMPAGMLRGFDPMLAQTLDDGSPSDWKESFYLARDLGPEHPYVKAKLPNHGPNQWPRDLPEFRAAIEAYYAPMCDLGRHLMRLVALSLSLDEILLRRRGARAGGDASAAALPAAAGRRARQPARRRGAYRLRRDHLAGSRRVRRAGG